MARKKLAIWQLAIAAVIFIASLAAFAVYLWTSVSAIGDGLKRMAVPGETVLDLDKDRYTVFHEFVSDYGGTRTTVPRAATLDVKISDARGDAVALQRVAGNTTYDTGERHGIGLYDFTPPSKGRYTIRVDGPRTVVAVGKSIDGAIVRTTFVSFTILFSGLGVSLALVAFALLRWAYSKA